MDVTFVSVAVLLLLLLLFASYVKTSPNIAMVISGLTKKPRYLVGKGGFRVPFLEKTDKLYLGQVTVDIKTKEAIPTNDFINVKIDAVAKVQVDMSDETFVCAIKNFLNVGPAIIAQEVQDTFEGNLRESVGAVCLKELNVDRDAFSDQVLAKATKDLSTLGLKVLSCNIQNISDENGLIKALGADNTWKIRQDAAITKANAEKAIAIAEANAAQEANDVRVLSETAIAEKNNSLEIRKAELQKSADTKKAEADAAYEIQKQEQQATIYQKTINAEIEKTQREQVLSQEKIKIKENELTAEVNKQADAHKYEVEKKAEAERYEAEQKAQAEAAKYAKLQEAEGIRAVGEANASAAQAMFIAEAEGLEKKADAYERFGQAAILDMVVKILPQVAAEVAKPISSIDSVNIYDGGVDRVSGNVPVVLKQTFDTIESATGVNLTDIVRAKTITAKTDRNINISGDLIGGRKETAEEEPHN
ncbi:MULTISPECIES: flotillin family protein [Bacteroidales]|jgi:flotillin|uniref:flotillin family protein n=1 Tax=Bacteroidales TaxID=171549 RepID=UPI00096AC049|nr:MULTISPECIES: flotillin family protein [Bacteroidales]MBX9054813.1 flotillin family protein [Parabacteroides merdae]MCO7170282.1 SPFH domain-containing protein [Parabacteroides merdae]MDB8919105.1 SPFH domain-containing protein [Parabacteroides merdae]MDB8927263.1 SPFH domain-containing protein [Parabacteroides merdae]RHL25087.1 flotillin family protein [Parabacteroides merdae]